MNATIDPEADRIAWRERMKEKICSRTDFFRNPQSIHTPYDLCHQMMDKLERSAELSSQTFLTINLEFVEVLCYDFGVRRENVWLVTECLEKAKIALKHPRYKGVNVIIENYLTLKGNAMKFDVICGNPPYQTQKDGDDESSAIWHHFVIQSLKLLKENGYLCLVHPAAWRGTATRPPGNVGVLLKNKQIKYLEIHNEADGLKTFGVETRYDWYILQNTPCIHPTIVVGQDGEKSEMTLNQMPFIPSGMLEEVKTLMAKSGEERTEVLHSETFYKHTQPWMHPTETTKYKHPCIYSIDYQGVPKFKYSSTRNNGHFGRPKVIFASGRISSANYVVDTKGEYGLTQWAKGIVDEPAVLPLIASAMRTKHFKRLMEACAIRYEINKGVIASFRKDFWKHFVDENGNELK